MNKNNLSYSKNIEIGNVILADINYQAKRPCHYPRPYIVLDKNDERAVLVPCSSVQGKENTYKKYDSNMTLKHSTIPPLEKDSFIHLNNMKIVDLKDLKNYPKLSKGRKINPLDLQEIKDNLRDYMIKENRSGNSHYLNPRFNNFDKVLDNLLSETKGTYFTTEDVMKKSFGYIKDRKRKDKKKNKDVFLYRPMNKPPTENSIDFIPPERSKGRYINWTAKITIKSI